MYMESIDDFCFENAQKSYELTQNVIEELESKNIKEHGLLENYMKYLKSMQKMMVDLTSVIGTFTNMSETGEPDATYIEWLKSTISFLQQAERDFLYMISDTCENLDSFIERIIPIEEKWEPGIVTLDIGISLPNQLKCKAKQIDIAAKLLDMAFEKQIRKPDESFEDVYIFYEHHEKRDSFRQIRDADNFDTKHLTDLIAFYYLSAGDGEAHVKIGHCVVGDEREYTRAVVVKSDLIDTYLSKKDGFFCVAK